MTASSPRARARTAAALAPVLVVAAGCAPSLATLQPAHVAPRGHVQVTAGLEVAVPTGTLVSAVDAGRALGRASQSQQLSADQEGRLFDAGVTYAASPVSTVSHFAVSYGVYDRTELGLRYASGAWRLGGRYQLLRHEDGPLDMVVGLGVSRATTDIPVQDVIQVLSVDDFTRWTGDLSLLVGTSRSWFRVWAGPKLVYTHFDTSLRADFGMNSTNPSQLAIFEGNGLYYGGQGGVALGYRKVFLGIELTLAELSGSATTSSSTVSTVGRTTDISGFVVYPAFALMGEF
jgi:hypothetical protein